MRSGRAARTPRGLVVAVYGVDGSGKSTLIDGLTEALGGSFRGVERWHVLHHQRPGSLQAPETDPHGRPPRSALASFAKALRYLTLAWLARAPSIARAVRRGGLVLLDRDIADVHLDPRRYRMGGPPWLTAWLAAAAPRPHLALVLHAPFEVIAARSSEIAPHELASLLERYERFAEGHAWARLIDTARPPDAVLSEACLTLLAVRGSLVGETASGHT